MGRGSSGITKSQRGSNKSSPAELKASINSADKGMKQASYIADKKQRDAAVKAATTRINEIARSMPLANVEAWHLQAMKKADEFTYASSIRVKYRLKGKEVSESLYRDNVELALRKHLRTRNRKKYNDEWLTNVMKESSKAVRTKYNV